MIKYLNKILLLLLILVSSVSFSNHWMGGEITWICQGGGDYVFTLKIYRDCSGPPVNTISQNIRVWNHLTLTQIPVAYFATNEVSPSCTQVTGGPAEISCTGNIVQGATEEYIFVSSPINIGGIPPAQGWGFTWDNLTRNASVINLVSPSTNGITLRAIMHSNGGSNTNPCFDSSPQFIESPSSIICAGNEFTYNPNAFEPDADSMYFSFGQPLNNISVAYNPPADPAPLNWASGYSITSPLPSATQNSGNIPATINPKNGEIHFKSNTIGSFALVVKAQSFRCGILLSEVYREMQIIVVVCGTNSPPTMIPPLNGNTSFSDTVTAGDFVSFTINASDLELLQDNSNQNVELLATGSQFGTNFTNSATGCNKPPCATLSSTPPIIGNQNLSTNFQWQTSCNHLNKNAFPGCSSNDNTYNFVFKVKDDFCPAPATKYYTVSITVIPPANLSAPEIKCVSVLPSGEVEITWTPIADPNNIFQEYEIYSSTGGSAFTSIGTISNINTSSFIHTGINAHSAKYNYLIATKSACDILNFTDTVSSIKLRVNNPNNGEAILQWNPVFSPTNSPYSSNWYYIYKEYPATIWTFVDSIPYGNEYYRDTITFCDDTVNYRVTITSDVCTSVSSIDGDNFKDLLPPKVPIIKNVSVDTSSGLAKVCWYPSESGDTEGYIILRLIGTTWQPIDTVYAGSNLCYTDSNSTPNFNSECYGVAAFDSCWYGNPLSPNTSAMGVPHCSILVTPQYDACGKTISLQWNDYTDWGTDVSEYNIYSSLNGSTTILASTNLGTNTSFLLTNVLPNSVYCFMIEAVAGNYADTATSNSLYVFTNYPQISDTNYLQVATVENSAKIRLKIYSSANSSISGYSIERSEDGVVFSNIGFAPYSSSPVIFDDNNVSPDKQNYYYRAIVVDSCGLLSDSITNIAKPILLTATSESNAFVIQLSWDNYFNWDGGVNLYEIYRKEGDSPYSLIGNVPFGTQNYNDDVSAFYASSTKGQFCYKIKAVENLNSYNISEESNSNEVCANIDYLLYAPNAFTPGGINPIFKPVIGFANFDSYSLTIYSRIYNTVFSTTDVNEGWDGTFKGRELQESVYIYFIQFNDSKGQPFQKVGHVTLLRP